jgi:hypothetical protein
MYATSADWSFDPLPEDFQSTSNDFPTEIKSMGALNFFYVQTSPTTARSMTIWPDKATAHAALSRIREGVAAETGQTIDSVCEGEVLASI